MLRKRKGPFARLGPAWAVPVAPWGHQGGPIPTPWVPPSPPVATVTNYYEVQFQPQIVHSVVLADKQ